MSSAERVALTIGGALVFGGWFGLAGGLPLTVLGVGVGSLAGLVFGGLV